LKKLSERVKSVDEILEEAKKILKDNVNSAMSFSDRVNLLEKLAHQIYLDEELKAIASYLRDNIPPEILNLDDREKLIDGLLIHIAKLIQERIAKDLPNIRRARAGSTAEKILQIALKEFEGIECEVLRKKKKEEYLPDLAVPDWNTLIENPDKGVAIAVKRTLRERWREDTTIFSKFKNAVFVCISEETDFGEDKIKAMLDEEMKAVFIPDKIYKEYEKLIAKNNAKNIFHPLSELPKYLRDILSKNS
jgi:hypothetical protein